MPLLATSLHSATEGRVNRGCDDTLRNATLAGEALSWGGDVALISKSTPSFLAGVASFFAAHGAYIVGFSSVRQAPVVWRSPGIAASLGFWLAAVPTMAYAAGRRSPELRWPVAAYGTILTVMFAASTTIGEAVTPRGRRMLRAGTLLFLTSDSLLGVQRFFLDEPSPALEGAVMATYTAGQGLIAAGVAARR